MPDALESQLRRALAPEDPGDAFTQAVLSRLPPPRSAAARPSRASRWLWIPAALAASIVGATILRLEYLEKRDGEIAKQQLLAALRVTSAKLDLAYRAVDSETDHD